MILSSDFKTSRRLSFRTQWSFFEKCLDWSFPAYESNKGFSPMMTLILYQPDKNKRLPLLRTKLPRSKLPPLWNLNLSDRGMFPLPPPQVLQNSLSTHKFQIHQSQSPILPFSTMTKITTTQALKRASLKQRQGCTHRHNSSHHHHHHSHQRHHPTDGIPLLTQVCQTTF